jgi:hypothetical protein
MKDGPDAAGVVNLTEKQKVRLAAEQLKVLLCLNDSQKAIFEALEILPKVLLVGPSLQPKIYPVTQAAWKAALAKIEDAQNLLRRATRIAAKKIVRLDDKALLLKNEDTSISTETARTLGLALKGRGRPRNEYREFYEQDLEKGLGCSSAAKLAERHFPATKGSHREQHRRRFQNVLNEVRKTQ